MCEEYIWIRISRIFNFFAYYCKNENQNYIKYILNLSLLQLCKTISHFVTLPTSSPLLNPHSTTLNPTLLKVISYNLTKDIAENMIESIQFLVLSYIFLLGSIFCTQSLDTIKYKCILSNLSFINNAHQNVF